MIRSKSATTLFLILATAGCVDPGRSSRHKPSMVVINAHERNLADPSERTVRIREANDNSNSSNKITLRISETIWHQLSESDRDLIKQKYLINVFKVGDYGRVVDFQVIDESQAATNAGARIGSAYGQAAYIDGTNWKNHSATEQVAAGVVGGIIGSLADQPATEEYHVRYTIQSSDGGTFVVDRIQSDYFGVSVGTCVNKDIAPFNTDYCKDQNIDAFKSEYLKR